MVIRRNIAERLQDRPHRFLTLTLAFSERPLANLLDKLLKCFKRLRSRQFWKDRVEGGAAFVEVTRGASGNHWHPHLHVILDSKFLPVDQLRAEWLRLTGDSYVLKIELVKDPERVRNYVAGYATKQLPADVVGEPTYLDEAITALKGRKLAYTFGAWSRWQLLTAPSQDGWTCLGHADYLSRNPGSADPDAITALIAYARWYPRANTLAISMREGERGPPEPAGLDPLDYVEPPRQLEWSEILQPSASRSYP